MRVRLLADDLAVELALGRHVDDDVAGDARRAAEAASLREAAVGGVARSSSPAGERWSRRRRRSRASRARPRRPRPGSGRRSRGRRRPSRGRRRACLAASSTVVPVLEPSAPARTGVKTTSASARSRRCRPPPALATSAAAARGVALGGVAVAGDPVRAVRRRCPSARRRPSPPGASRRWSGLVIAEVRPDAIAIGRKAAFSAGRFGSPKLTLDAPHVVFTPSSSRSRRTIRKT